MPVNLSFSKGSKLSSTESLQILSFWILLLDSTRLLARIGKVSVQNALYTEPVPMNNLQGHIVKIKTEFSRSDQPRSQGLLVSPRSPLGSVR